jgi:hypothetical protein
MSKLRNSYQEVLDRDVFDRMPKAVLAAIAVSFANQIAGAEDIESFDGCQARILDEWRILNQNGIVPQRPIAPRRVA